VIKFSRLIKFLYLYGRKIEIPSNPSINKFNIYFLKKVADLFAGITYILYLRALKEKKLNIKRNQNERSL